MVFNMTQREIDFYKSLNGLSERTINNYQTSLRSRFIKGLLMTNFSTDNLFNIDSLDKLWKLYSLTNLHPTNISNHRRYSCAIMKYIRFLNNGNKYGKRIDYQRPRTIRKGN